jgi:hypothetical protein
LSLTTSIASVARRPSSAESARRVAAWLAAGVAVIALGACGSGDESAGQPAAPTPLVDAVTGEPVEAPDDFTLDFGPVDELPAGPPPADEGVSDQPARGDGEPRPTDGAGPDAGAGDGHPLETTVIETVAADPDAAPVLDEAAALACANTEFAMDALIESSPERTERFASAAQWATASSYPPIRAFADRLGAGPTGTQANELVVAVLETCAAAGYEL